MQSRNTADGGLEDPLVTVHEEKLEEVDPRVTEFLLRKPWYAGTTYDADGNADADSDADTERPRASALHKLLDGRGIGEACPSEEDKPRINAKMQAMGYSTSPHIPTRTRSSRSEDHGQKPVYFNFDENHFPQDTFLHESDTEFDESFDDTSRPQSSESIKDVH